MDSSGVGPPSLPSQGEAERASAVVLAGLFGESVVVAGRYELGKKIGAGGLGFVHEAVDQNLGRKVALKFPKGASGNPDIVEDLRREAKVLAPLQHPNIVTVFDVGESEQGVYLAMELIDGMSLRSWMEQERRDWRAVVEVMRDAGAGLAAAHEAGVVHRDFKPSNVMVDQTGRVRVVDFGLAREVMASVDGSGADTSGETHKTSAAGTPPYMAPEQFEGEVSAASDQFAFCTALYEGICGKRPWRGRDRGVTRGGPSAGAIERELKRGGLPKRLRAVVLRGLAEEPGERFESMGALVGALRMSRGRGPIVWGSVAVVATAVAGILMVGRGPDACSRVESRARPALADPLASFEFPNAQLEGDFEAFLSDWDRFEQATCRARENESITSKLLDARERCLDRVTRRLGFAFEELPSDPDARVVQAALLPSASIQPCTNDEGLLLQESEEGLDPALQDRVLERAAEASVLLGLGREPEALELLETTHGERDANPGASFGYARLGLIYASLLSSRGQLGEARDVLFDELVAVSEKPRLALVAAEVRAMLAYVLSHSPDDVAEAQRLATLAGSVLEKRGGHGMPRSMAQLALARSAAMSGDEDATRRSLDALDRVVENYDPAKDPHWRDYERNRLDFQVAASSVVATLGDTQGAIERYEAVIPELRRRSDTQRALATALNNLGELMSQDGSDVRAADRLEESASLKRKLGDPAGAAFSWMNAGTAHQRGKRYGRAVEAYETALAVVPEAERGERFELLYNLGLAHKELGELGRARRAFDEAIGLGDVDAEPKVNYFLFVASAQVALQMQDISLTTEHHDRALDLERPRYSSYARSELRIVECELLARRGESTEAERRRAVQLATEAGDADLLRLARTCGELGGSAQ